MKRILLICCLLVGTLLAAGGDQKRPRIDLFVASVLWAVDGKIYNGVYIDTGTDPDMMTPIVTADLQDKFPKGYSLISLKTRAVEEHLLERIIENRTAPKGKRM